MRYIVIAASHRLCGTFAQLNQIPKNDITDVVTGDDLNRIRGLSGDVEVHVLSRMPDSSIVSQALFFISGRGFRIIHHV